MNAAESDVWNQGKEDLIDIAVMREMLESLRNELGASVLTVRSLRFLQVRCFRHTHRTQSLSIRQITTDNGRFRRIIDLGAGV